jgi:diketogulonate reductase-like aldo/keto reductase
MTRKQFLRLATGVAAGLVLPAESSAQANHRAGAIMSTRMSARPIPSSGEALPVVGCGTYQGFDVAQGSSEYQRLPAVLQALFDAGGSVLDSSPMYGRAEEVTGDLLAASRERKSAFVATKVWTTGRDAGVRQMQQSMRLLQVDTLDLMQIHNLLDWRTHLATLREWKAQGRIRYIGITHYTSSAYRDLEAVMRAERLDFVQINYSLDEREAERRILPLAAERGMAVLINRPFGGGGLLRRLSDKPLPPWAAEIGATSWAQVLLKFVLSQPAVTCVIPGSGRPEHMADNAAAGVGRIPAPDFWVRHGDLLKL